MLCQAELLKTEEQTKSRSDTTEWTLNSPPALTIEVITGLSQGEQLKLDDSPILIGGSEDCDIYLSEPSMSKACLVAELSHNKVHVSPIHNSGTDAHFGAGKFKKSITGSTYFLAGDSFCLGGVWLKVSDIKKDRAKGTMAKPKPPKSAEFSRTSRKAFELDTDNDRHFLRWAGLKAGSLFLSSIGICALTISVAQGVNKPADLAYSDQQKNYGEALLADIRTNIENDTMPSTGQASNQVEDSVKVTNIRAEEKLPYLSRIFSQMLTARELPQTVSLSHEKGSWVISGHLDKEKQRILDRMISRFKSEQDIKSPIANKVKSAFSSLPFEIVQVTSGRYGNIVTQSGDRLFVGDQLDGYQLVAIQDHQLVFTGKSRVTVAW